ncbi:MAG: DNA repair protein RecN [Rhodoluna sp.]|jgi:DNA repair protein RecN (Recombination protein N)
MIEEIQISDLGVIKNAELVFSPGFTVLTGETGAGKTMVLTALGLLLGERSDSAFIRAGAAQTNVTGAWRISSEHPAATRIEEAGGLVDDGQILLGRTVSADGRSKAVAGGRQIPVGLLSEIGSELVVVHGQSDQIRLKSQTAQREALDKFAGAEHQGLLIQYQALFNLWREIQRKLNDAQSGKEKIALEKSELTEALEFLGKLNPKQNEDVELQELAQRLTHTEALRNAVGMAHDLLQNDDFEISDAVEQIGKARKALESAVNYDASLENDAQALRDFSQQLSEIVANLSSYLASIEGDGKLDIDQIQERRSELSLAMRRYGPTLEDVITFQENAKIRLAQLSGGEESIEKLQSELSLRQEQLQDLAERISVSRKAAAEQLASRVSAELSALAMADATLKVNVESTGELGTSGADNVSFLLQPYTGAEARPIAKSASGGELSRIMLALEVVLSESETAVTFIFDEVDAGVGGAAAIEVGKRLAALAKSAQVIVVTHLAQVAAFANNHLVVIKSAAGEVTASDIRSVTGSDRATELARMLSGLQDSASAQSHANELLSMASNS